MVFKYGKLIIPKENQSLNLHKDLVAYSVMIKDYSDNKNKYFVKDTTFNVPNEGFGDARFMLRPIYEENFDFERDDSDPYFFELARIQDEKNCHYPFDNISFCHEETGLSLKNRDVPNFNHFSKKLLNNQTVFRYKYLKYDGDVSLNMQKKGTLPITFVYGKNKNDGTYSSYIYVPGKHLANYYNKPFLAVRSKIEFFGDDCGLGDRDRDCDFYNFLSCDVEGLCDEGENGLIISWIDQEVVLPVVVNINHLLNQLMAVKLMVVVFVILIMIV